MGDRIAAYPALGRSVGAGIEKPLQHCREKNPLHGKFKAAIGNK